MRHGPNTLPPDMMKNANPVEVLLLGAWLALEAAAVLLAAKGGILCGTLCRIGKGAGH